MPTTKTEKRDKGWVDDWCRDNAEELASCARCDSFAVLHQELGIVFRRDSMEELFELVSALRKRIRRDIAYVEIDEVLKRVGYQADEKADAKPVDPFDNDAWPQTVEQYAKRRKLKPTDVLLKLMELRKHGTGINLKMVLTSEDVLLLDEAFPLPFPSPHKQPEFMPRPGGWRSSDLFD